MTNIFPKPILRSSPVDATSVYYKSDKQFGDYYHRDLSNEDVNKIFSNQPDGAFLVRNSPNNPPKCIVTFKLNNQIENLPISYINPGVYRLDGHREIYSSLYKLMEHVLPAYVNDKNYQSPGSQLKNAHTLNYNLNCGISIMSNMQRARYHRISLSEESHRRGSLPEKFLSQGQDINSRTIKALEKMPLRPAESETVLTKPTPSYFKKEKILSYNGDEKKHNFQSDNPFYFANCVICKKKIWLFISPRCRCQDCEVTAHKSCIDLDEHAYCQPTMNSLKRLFGVELETLRLATHEDVPPILCRLVKIVEDQKGFLVKGIYRVSGTRDKIEEFTLLLNKFGDKADISDCLDIHVYTDLIKKFLHKLPTTLIPKSCYEELLNLSKIKRKEKIIRYKEVLHKLPTSHYATLQFLICHLRKVSDHANENCMTSGNLSIIFSVILMPLPAFQQSDSLESTMNSMVNDINQLNTIVTFLIDFSRELFLND